MTDDPPPALSRQDELARTLDEGDGLLVGLDFDGTLTPIVSDPDEAGLTERVMATMREFVENPRVGLAVVSGRGLDDIVDRVGVDGPIYAGNHGMELAQDDRRVAHPEAEAQRSVVRDVAEELGANLADVSGATVEDKGLTSTVHFREADDPDSVVSTVETLASTADGDVRVTAGKCVREIRPDVEWDKGAAMAFLLERTPDGYLPLYVGDDRTDEDAFEVVEEDGLAVRVGSDTGTDTVASYQVANQEMVPPFLEWLLEYANDRWEDEAPPEEPLSLERLEGPKSSSR